MKFSIRFEELDSFNTSLIESEASVPISFKDSIKGDKGDKGEAGSDGKDGTSASIVSCVPSLDDDGISIVTFSDGTVLNIKNGSKGSTGEQGIQGIQGEQGIQGQKGDKGDSYTITDADYDAIAKKVDVPSALPNPNALTINGTSYDGSEPVEMTLQKAEEGKGLSSNDFTDGYKSEVDSLWSDYKSAIEAIG